MTGHVIVSQDVVVVAATTVAATTVAATTVAATTVAATTVAATTVATVAGAVCRLLQKFGQHFFVLGIFFFQCREMLGQHVSVPDRTTTRWLGSFAPSQI